MTAREAQDHDRGVRTFGIHEADFASLADSSNIEGKCVNGDGGLYGTGDLTTLCCIFTIAGIYFHENRHNHHPKYAPVSHKEECKV